VAFVTDALPVRFPVPSSAEATGPFRTKPGEGRILEMMHEEEWNDLSPRESVPELDDEASTRAQSQPSLNPTPGLPHFPGSLPPDQPPLMDSTTALVTSLPPVKLVNREPMV
jgi:hypothetical protein